MEGAGGGGRRAGDSTPKDEKILIKWLDRFADALKRLAENAVEALPATVGSVVCAILSFLGKAVVFVAEYTWALIVLLQDLLIGGSCKKLKRGRSN